MRSTLGILSIGTILAVSSLAASPLGAQRASRYRPRLLVVDNSGAPDAEYRSLQEAVDAAFEGDRILVRDGFSPPVEIVGKSLTIEADTARRSYVEQLTVRDLAPRQSVTVRGLRIADGSALIPPSALVVRNCAGSVWVEELDLEPRSNAFASSLVVVEDSASVVISRGRFSAQSPVGSPVLELRDSTTYLFDTYVSGGESQTLIHLENGFLGFYGGTLDGCGFYCTPGRPLHLTGVDPVAQLQSVAQRTGSAPRVDAGHIEQVSSLQRDHEVSSPVYDDEPVEIVLRGRPGDMVWLLTTVNPRLGAFLPGADVPLLLNTANLSFIGTMTSSTLAFDSPTGSLPPGAAASVRFQTFVVNSAPAETVLSEPTAVTFLDASLRPSEHVFSDTPQWQAAPPGNVAFGASVASAGDVNGDGFDDVIIGDPGFDYVLDPSRSYPAYWFRGQVRVYHGSAAGLPADPNWSHIGETFQYSFFSEGGPSGLGTVVGAAGDVNGDGFGDVFATRSDLAQLHVFYGSPAGVSDTGATTISGGDGYRICAAGDVDGDGFDDLWQGGDSGASLFRGSAGGLMVTPAWSFAVPNAGNNHLGFVAAAGDANGDGRDDLLVQWWRTDIYPRLSVVTALILGASTPTLAWTYEDEDDFYWNPLAGVGDLDQDGFDDFVLGSPPHRMLVFHGAPTPGATPQILASPFLDGGYQGSLRAAGDVDHDGRPDMMALRNGTWSLLRGTPSGPSRSPSWSGEQIQEGSTSVAGDVNGDGAVDLLVGTYDSYIPDGAAGGTVRLLLGIP